MGPRVEKLFEIIHEDAELLVINKPAGLVCHPTKTDAYSSVISRARLYLGAAARPQLVNRLDRETGGVTLVAKQEKVALRLRRLWAEHRVRKEYVAIVHGYVAEAHGIVDAPLGKDEQSRVAIKDCVRADGTPAQTEYWVEQRFSHAEFHDPKSQGDSVPSTHARRAFTFLRVVPRTGRKHQIRIQLAHLGYPIVGDKLYGGDEDLYLSLVENRLTAEQWRRLLLPHHALHACEVRFPWQGQERVFRAQPEDWFERFVLQGRPTREASQTG